MLSYFKFHHIGIATNNIERTAQYYIDAGYVMSEVVYDDIQNASIAFLEKSWMPCIELIGPPPPNIQTSKNSPVDNIIRKSGVSPYHVCYEVEDIDVAEQELRKKKFISLSRLVVGIATSKRILFLYNKDVGLIELIERDISQIHGRAK